MLVKSKKSIISSQPFSSLIAVLPNLRSGEPVIMEHLAGSLLAFIAAGISEQESKQVLVIAADEDRAEQLRDDCALLTGDGRTLLFGARPMHYTQALDMSATIAQIETLKALTSSSGNLIIASADSIVEKLRAREAFISTVLELHAGEEINFQELIERLENLGFVRKDFIEGYGDFAVRGGILDVFPYIGENPIRCEFWGNMVESIREFDVLSQRSIRKLQSASIVPDPEASVKSNTLPGEVDDRATRASMTASMFDYLSNDVMIILEDPVLIEREYKELIDEGKQNLFEWDYIEKKIFSHPCLISASFVRRTQPEESLEEHEVLDSLYHNQVRIDFSSIPSPVFGGSVRMLIEKISELTAQGFTSYLTCDTSVEAKRLKELIDEVINEGNGNAGVLNESLDQVRGTTRPVFEVLSETVHSGFIYPPAKIAVFTEHEIFGRLKRRGSGKRRRFKGISQKELGQLKIGDYIVHVDHGIGTFDGLRKIKVGNVEQEVMKVLFLENDVLYVNLNAVNRVQKYSSQEGHAPKLSKLGTPEWERLKSKAKKRIKDIARDLIKLYARRKKEEGFAFSPDTHWQRELEASFMYEDTPDQIQTTIDVKNDMEALAPMDRLICGDVGFGKTEIAVRAAFKSVNDSKQVAILVPTTILALQHYNTFKDRISRFSVKVENITRFRSKKEQNEILEGLKTGSVDILIGTHRLLSKDVVFKDLGLLVIDEEHRFGVTAKEKLRQLKATVDTLTLTATPIPRTLHFSLIGARDLSLINTPPRNRMPVLTEIVPANGGGRDTQWRIVREAIIHELHRDGQIYVVHDRVNNIEEIADKVRALVPEAKVHIAHGQMEGHQLEKTMLDFLEKKYNVLVCTKIIESGLDIPSVNTIVINRADRFGLAELYQLRGRVGRSNQQAYAYLLTPPLSVVPKQSLRRLQAIEEFVELGSGFNLAMRDLELRGTGNLLGAEQSGFILEMGFEMYERIVRESVEELKLEEFSDIFKKKKTPRKAEKTRAGISPESRDAVPAQLPEPVASQEVIVDADVEAFLPEFYVESQTERLDFYRRLYRLVDRNMINDMRAELEDRFGEYPEEVEHLFYIVELKLLAGEIGFTKVELRPGVLALTLPEESRISFYGADDDPTSPFQKLMVKIAEGKGKTLRLQPEGKTVKLMVAMSSAQKPGVQLAEAIQKLMEVKGWVRT
ncbi:MAG: transcription-repair coupling factor [Bacteroidota bacterium]